ncbi:hypothetical protein BXZ70DRAFT_471969 [Cristinia sonorae]|uniref:Fungal-type protein kinase domain-containing protein n=1 Tax=Cristinia sonorae TaxID=1940300 RepID=A0A8K0UJI5_9AGAR|nr:hypothetical protein BXZ70DRAFT_471969 [Cristinia sonorae]
MLMHLKMRDLEKIATLWWLRIVVPIEMKPKFNPKSVQVGSSRLLRYMRLVLRNQLDRRFVFGILICSHFMRVFFCDRSGLLTTSEWIDLHDPKTFVHVILAFSSLDVFKLGWDETMKLHLQSTSTPSNLKFEYSTDPSVRLQDYGKSSYETQWSIFVPDQMGSKTGKDYVTVRALSLKQAEVMAGRATVVWMVKELNEGSPRTVKQDPTGVIKVLKSAWNRSHPPSPTEKELLGDTVLEHVVNIECSVPVGMSTLQTGDDLPAIRGRIQGKNGVWENGVQLGTIMKTAKRKARTTESEDVSDVTSHRTLAQQPNRVSSTLVSRVLTRTVMRTYGWPIKFFKDRVELVTILRDTVIGHRELYFKRKVAHRDVSTGNVMACPIRGDVAKTQGVLIDLDHAKMAKERISLVDFHNVPRPLHKFWVSIQNTYDSFRDEDLGRRLWHYSRGDATKAGQIVKLCAYHCNALGAKYVDESKWDNIENELRSLLPSSTLISQGYFLDEKNCPPSWVKSELRSNIGARIGTLPFMSYEVLFSPQQYPVKFSNLRTDVVNLQPVHGAIHDLESLFWIFLYLCLTRAGPGGKRRADFDEEPTGECDAVAKLHAIVWRLFESPEDHEIAFNKRDLFIHPESLKTLLIPAMHPYFEPLHQLLIDWWGLLRSSYQTYNDIEQGLIHLKVIELLGATLRDLKNSQVDELELENNEEVKAMTEAELERRRVDLERYRLYPHPYDPSLAPQPPLEPVSHVASPKATAGKRVAGSENQVVSHSSPESQTSHRPRKKAHMASYHDGE